MKTINELQDEIIEEFAVFDDWMDKYSLLIDMGRNLTPLDESLKTPDNRIEGCQSNVWLDARMQDDLLIFTADSDAVLVKGIVSVLVHILSGHTPEEVLDAELYCIEQIGLKEHLSPTRSNGLLAMVKQMKMYALAFQARNKA
ncbi:MAG: SufE family protein [Paludibacteraceae bacterium]|nr:SufE family protein [Paludibacteraceae bacterium]